MGIFCLLASTLKYLCATREPNAVYHGRRQSLPGKKDEDMVYRSSSRVERDIGGQRPGDRQTLAVARTKRRWGCYGSREH
ncbi:hypothetical protein C8R46DRAFT_1104759 [Mycena filopes]|nr:hypothetical protein C8R46DRAFT_1104759 [Mycena filopes]